MARYPERLLTDDETVIAEFNPHWRMLLSAIGWTLVAVVVAVLPNLFWGAALVLPVSIAVGVLVVLALVVPKVVTWRFTVHVLTTERIIVRSGVLRRSATEIPLENINNVLFDQNVVERLLGYGDVLVESAGSMGQSRLTDIPDPEAFQAEIYRAREVRSMQMMGGGAGPRDAVAQLEALARLHEQGVVTDEEFSAKKAQLLGEA